MGRSFTRGYVRVRPAKKNGCWQFDWKDPEDKTRIQKRVRCASAAEARDVADHINREVVAGRGLLPTARPSLSVDQLLAEAIQSRRRANDITKRGYVLAANLFGRWLNEKRPSVKAWADVDARAIADYVAHCETAGLSNDTIHRRLFVLKMASRYASELYDLADVVRSIRFERRAVNPLEHARRETQKALPAAVLLRFLNHLQEHRTDLYPIACLQGLCGLRAMEASNIREQDIDFQAGTVTVDETPWHKPKNAGSHRAIPVPGAVLDALRGWIAALKVRREDGALFATERGGQPWSLTGLTHAMRRELLACWKATGIEQLRTFQPHWLRATCVSLVRAERLDLSLAQRYIGHTPATVLERHYEVVALERLREVPKAVETILAREHLCEQGKVQNAVVS